MIPGPGASPGAPTAAQQKVKKKRYIFVGILDIRDFLQTGDHVLVNGPDSEVGLLRASRGSILWKNN